MLRRRRPRECRVLLGAAHPVGWSQPSPRAPRHATSPRYIACESITKIFMDPSSRGSWTKWRSSPDVRAPARHDACAVFAGDPRGKSRGSGVAAVDRATDVTTRTLPRHGATHTQIQPQSKPAVRTTEVVHHQSFRTRDSDARTQPAQDRRASRREDEGPRQRNPPAQPVPQGKASARRKGPVRRCSSPTPPTAPAHSSSARSRAPCAWRDARP